MRHFRQVRKRVLSVKRLALREVSLKSQVSSLKKKALQSNANQNSSLFTLHSSLETSKEVS